MRISDWSSDVCSSDLGASKPTEIPMPSVKVRENEPFEFALRRFKRTCEKAGVLAETRKREYYEKPTQERKRKAAAAVKRQASRTPRDVKTGRESCRERVCQYV